MTETTTFVPDGDPALLINGKSPYFKCTKCNKVFVIGKFARQPDYEYCPYCGRKNNEVVKREI